MLNRTTDNKPRENKLLSKYLSIRESHNKESYDRLSLAAALIKKRNTLLSPSQR